MPVEAGDDKAPNRCPVSQQNQPGLPSSRIGIIEADTQTGAPGLRTGVEGHIVSCNRR
jgi:hypothetical protein